MTTPKLAHDTGLSTEQLDSVQRFEADYNAVDHLLREALGSDKHVPFIQLVRRYEEAHRNWDDGELLKTVAHVRNLIVHEKKPPYHYVAIPTPTIADQLQKCHERLLNPARVIPAFQKQVEVVSSADSLARVLALVHKRDYSQFPVYEHEKFRGLLTENGVTRWLARHVSETLSLLELNDISVAQVLKNEEKGKNYWFVRRDTRVDDVIALFSNKPMLEAVLITLSGTQTERLLGIVTRWDILRVEEKRNGVPRE